MTHFKANIFDHIITGSSNEVGVVKNGNNSIITSKR